jgi:hypothetical protein
MLQDVLIDLRCSWLADSDHVASCLNSRQKSIVNRKISMFFGQIINTGLTLFDIVS